MSVRIHIAVIVRGELGGKLCRTQVVENIHLCLVLIEDHHCAFPSNILFVLKSEINAACLVSFKDILLHLKIFSVLVC